MQPFTHLKGIVSREKSISTTQLNWMISLFFVLACNGAFFTHVFNVYPLSSANIAFIISLGIGLSCLVALFLTLITSKHTIKPILVILLLISSITAYFMDNYSVIIDDNMLQSMLETNWSETADLMSWDALYYLLFLGVIPGILVFRVKIKAVPFQRAVLYKGRDSVFSIFLLCLMLFSFSKFYTSFFREHKSLRFYTNPSYYLYSAGKYASNLTSTKTNTISPLGMDAEIINKYSGEQERPKLIILVVGEAVRADHLSLNGYPRTTTPLLEQENIINFGEMYSCGTSTAYSVPCMFSSFTRKSYSPQKGRTTENLLDVLTRTGAIDVLWRDNNSDSKGVALRVPFEDYSTPQNNPICTDNECRDEGMLVNLDQYVAKHSGKDLLIVLHQMGNHGPAYYKRYPKAFKKFIPVCNTNQLEECSKEEIINAYDNTLLYTDYFLSGVIDFLKGYNKSHSTTMLYFSDHGESLGEKGLYLHGMPYAIAPQSQTHIASLMWFGDDISKQIDVKNIRQRKDQYHSHDNLFHTVLGLFDVSTEVYDNKLDICYSPDYDIKLAELNDI